MPVNNEAFQAIESYEFADSGYASLYEAILTMHSTCTPVVRPDFDGFYDRVNQLYDGLRQSQPDLRQRSDEGEDAEGLAAETWEFFCSIQ